MLCKACAVSCDACTARVTTNGCISYDGRVSGDGRLRLCISDMETGDRAKGGQASGRHGGTGWDDRGDCRLHEIPIPSFARRPVIATA